MLIRLENLASSDSMYCNCIMLPIYIFVVPGEPRTLEIFTINSSSVTLQWTPPDPPNGVITHYSIQRNGTDRNDLNSSVLMYTIGGLSPDTVYVLLLSAHTIVGEGPSSTITVVTGKLFNSVSNGYYI